MAQNDYVIQKNIWFSSKIEWKKQVFNKKKFLFACFKILKHNLIYSVITELSDHGLAIRETMPDETN